MNVGFCQLVRRAPWGRRSVATKWGSQPLGSNLNGDVLVLMHYNALHTNRIETHVLMRQGLQLVEITGIGRKVGAPPGPQR